MNKAIFLTAAVGLMINGTFLASQAAETVDFSKDIRPILELNCTKCHGPEQHKGKLRLDSREAALKGGDNGPALVPGKPEESKLYTSTVLPPDHDDVMPPKKEGHLSKGQTDLIKGWIQQGADWPAGVTLVVVRKVDFEKDIQPILEFNCVACHRETHDKGGLRLDNKMAAFKGGESGAGIVPRNKAKSFIYTSVTAPVDDDKLMPPQKKGGPLPKESIDLLASWIDQGASWPDGLTLNQKKKEEAPGANEGLTVSEIHKLILSKLDVRSEAEMKVYTNNIPGTQVSFSMAPIPGGEFTMGSPAGDAGRKEDESPQHKVKISPFWMGQCEVTWSEYELFMFPDFEKATSTPDQNPYASKTSDAVSRPTKPYVEMSFGMGKDRTPAISMTQHAANKYCEWLSAKTGQYYRLPTEAEWEYACRAGTTTAYSFGDDVVKLPEYAWYGTNSDFKYQKVGKKKPNPWGLYDMHGNVAEWCLDQYVPNYNDFAKGVSKDPWIPSTTPYPHSVRGGSWNDDEPGKLRSAARLASDKSWKQQDPQLPKSIWYLTDAQFLGFRVVRPLNVPPPEEMQKMWNNGVEHE
ncbi:MAG TPA: SUMF1/EgtB/PvdO family nonheme iron enzyme [Candidatus Saccharimonadales bacterium]|nr:SUMF1/EgtB/PvdO family nonheme iron enzyme [Candidatus Saccharimonadales bacterium]